MGKYYCLVAGLPSIAPDDEKITYSVSQFKTEVEPLLSDGDRRILQLFFMKYDNANLLNTLRKTSAPFDERGNIPSDTMLEFCETLQKDNTVGQNPLIPPYFEKFATRYLAHAKDNPSSSAIIWEDILATLYYGYATKCPNTFTASWFELNLNIGNLLAAINCRKYGWNKDDYIIGDNETARQIRTSSARDFGLGDSLDYFMELQHIADEKDLMVREQRIDVLKWNWLDENTFFKTFDFETVFTYLLRLEMIERRVKLDKELGEKTFRQLVDAMKRDSIRTLEEFKKNNR